MFGPWSCLARAKHVHEGRKSIEVTPETKNQSRTEGGWETREG